MAGRLYRVLFVILLISQALIMLKAKNTLATKQASNAGGNITYFLSFPLIPPESVFLKTSSSGELTESE